MADRKFDSGSGRVGLSGPVSSALDAKLSATPFFTASPSSRSKTLLDAPKSRSPLDSANFGHDSLALATAWNTFVQVKAQIIVTATAIVDGNLLIDEFQKIAQKSFDFSKLPDSLDEDAVYQRLKELAEIDLFKDIKAQLAEDFLRALAKVIFYQIKIGCYLPLSAEIKADDVREDITKKEQHARELIQELKSMKGCTVTEPPASGTINVSCSQKPADVAKACQALYKVASPPVVTIHSLLSDMTLFAVCGEALRASRDLHVCADVEFPSGATGPIVALMNLRKGLPSPKTCELLVRAIDDVAAADQKELLLTAFIKIIFNGCSNPEEMSDALLEVMQDLVLLMPVNQREACFKFLLAGVKKIYSDTLSVSLAAKVDALPSAYKTVMQSACGNELKADVLAMVDIPLAAASSA
jgi:hypothetical protein